MLKCVRKMMGNPLVKALSQMASGERGRHFTVVLLRANHKEFKVVGEEILILTELAVWCGKLRCRMGR